MRKFKTKIPLLTLLALFLFGFGHAKADNLTLGVQFTVGYSPTGTKYNFTSPGDGSVKVVLSPAAGYGAFNMNDGANKILYTASNVAVDPISTDDDAYGRYTVKEATFPVSKDGAYYVKFPYWEGNVVVSFIEDGSDPGEDVIVWGDLNEADLSTAKGRTYTDTPFNLRFTPETDGVLSITQVGSSKFVNFLYSDEECTQLVENSNGIVLEGPLTYDLTSLTTYYYRTDANVSQATFKYESTGEGEWKKMQFDYDYTASAKGDVKLFFTPETDGTLTVIQTGKNAYDGHMFKEMPEDGDWGYDNQYSKQLSTVDGSYSGTNPYTLVYKLVSGNTYYAVAKLTSGDVITGIKFQWEPSAGVQNIINLEEKTSIPSGEIYKFVCEKTGVLAVEANDGYANEMRYGVLYSDSGATKAVPQAGIPDDGSVLKGYKTFYAVEAGNNYYVKNPLSRALDFYLTLEEGQITVKVESVLPAAGSLDLNQTEATFALTFSPSDVKFDDLVIEYVNLDGENKTIFVPATSYEFAGGAWQIPLPMHMTTLGERKDDGTADLINNCKQQTTIKYTFNNANFNGTQVSETAVTNGVEVNNGNVIISFYLDKGPSIASEQLPETFHKEFAKGDDNGIVVITYDKELDTEMVPEVSIIEGKQVYGGQPGEEIASWLVDPSRVTVSGKTLTIDFTDGEFTYGESIKEWGPSTDYITLGIAGVFGTNGLMAMYDGAPMYMPQIPYVEEEEFVEPKLISVTPDVNEDVVINSMDEIGDFVVTATFSAPVKVTKAETGDREKNLLWGISPANEYSEVVKMTFPKSAMLDLVYGRNLNDEFSPIKLYFYCEDVKGNPVIKDEDNGEIFQYIYRFVTDIAPGAPFNVEAPTTGEKSINTFNVSVETPFTYIEQSNALTGIKVKGENFAGTATGFENGVVTFTPGITKPGEYTINFPYNAFTIGANYDSGFDDNTDGDSNPEDGGNQLGGDNQYGSMAQVYTFTVTEVKDAEEGEEPGLSGDAIVFDDPTWHPAASDNWSDIYNYYYYRPKTTERIRFELYDNGQNTQQGMTGGLFKGEEMLTPDESDGSYNASWGMWLGMSYAEFELEAGVEYNFWWTKSSEYTVLFTKVRVDEEPQDITVNVGKFEPQAWTHEGLVYNGVVSCNPADEDNVNLTITVTPNFEKVEVPESVEESELWQWEWDLNQAVKDKSGNVDGYWSGDPYIEKIFIDGQLNLTIVFPCSGSYTIKLEGENLVFEGEAEQELIVLPNLQNTYDFELNGESYTEQGLTINGVPVENGNVLNFPVVDGQLYMGGFDGDASESVLVIPGLCLAEIWYYYDGMPAAKSVKAMAAATAPAGYRLVGADGKIDLSGASTETATELHLYVIKNGVHVGPTDDAEGNNSDYIFTINPSTAIDTPTGVAGIDSEDAEAIYFDLNGCKVNSDNLQKGIYIVKKGNKTYKVIL